MLTLASMKAQGFRNNSKIRAAINESLRIQRRRAIEDQFAISPTNKKPLKPMELEPVKPVVKTVSHRTMREYLAYECATRRKSVKWVKQ